MLRDQNIICISSIDWDFIWQGHQEVMSTLARNGNRVIFIENTGVRTPGIKDILRIKNRIKNWLRGVKGIRQEMENLYVFSPLVLPFPYSRLARMVNRRLVLSILEKWMKIIDFKDPIVWTFLPTPLSVDLIDNVFKKLTIYYCIDNFSASSPSAKKIRKSETILLKKADLVFVTSGELREYAAKYNDKVFIFPFAVNIDNFEDIRLRVSAPPKEIADIKRPIVGYVGGVHKWINQRLIRVLAERYREYSFIFIGPIQTDISLLSELKNIHFLGDKDHRRLPSLIKEFDACIIPYLITEYTRNVYPTKLNEYLVMGRPVVSTALPEVEAFNKRYNDVVLIARDEEEFAECIKKAVFEEKNPIAISRRVEVAGQNSWKRHIEDMSELISAASERKRIDRETRWRENLLVFYKRARRKAMKIAVVCLLFYLLLFKTPFIWFLASPLRISNPPDKADVIVVFGGGVGESGSPGKSTIERARFAAELYKEGYANKIIFSSGYTYTYNDAENMRLLALSIGVLDRDIILEEKANSTYENVVFSKAILDREGWKSVLLVSSPYNMRRASLVFNKWKDDLKVFYIPVKICQFYDRTEGLRLDQAKAILHEYGGIIYYWLKGDF